jgi:hypothetical protein
METGIVFTSAFRAGATPGFGKRCLSTLPGTLIWKACCWTAQWFALTRVQQAHKKSGEQADQALGRTRGGFSTRIHVSTDGLGNPLRVRLTAGERHDSTKAVEMVGVCLPVCHC